MKVLEEFKELIKKEKYYQAHEILEQEWQKIRKSDNPYKNVYRGFINAAVSLELKKRNKNFKKVWMTYEKYKDLYFEKKEFIDVMEFLDKLKPF